MRYVGAMTGTSVDGLDVALLTIDAGIRIDAARTVRLPQALARSLKALAVPGTGDVDHLAATDASLGQFIGESVLCCLHRWRVAPADIRAIGSHGQTVRHRPDFAPSFTMQIGDANRIAEITGIDTVADFRRRDVAAGGEGAPLTPLFHDALFRDGERHRLVVNFGGIANLTVLAAGDSAIRGFDTGPGNALLDAWIHHCKDEAFDRDGAWGAGGTVMTKLLERLQRDPYLDRTPPKSTGKEHYHLGYIRAAGEGLDLEVRDVQATLTEFTAWSVADAVRRWGTPAGDVVVCGGGRRNRYLMARLRANLDGYRLLITDDLGVDGDALEAAAFAWFAHLTLHRLPGNVPTVTGALGERVLGAIYPA